MSRKTIISLRSVWCLGVWCLAFGMLFFVPAVAQTPPDKFVPIDGSTQSPEESNNPDVGMITRSFEQAGNEFIGGFSPTVLGSYFSLKLVKARHPIWHADPDTYSKPDTNYEDTCIQQFEDLTLTPPIYNEIQGARVPSNAQCTRAGAVTTSLPGGTAFTIPDMPHRSTPRVRVHDYSPWLLKNQQAIGGQGPYRGVLYRGHGSTWRDANRLVQNEENVGVPPVDGCSTIIANGITAFPNDPIAARRELDSCANQYLLHRAASPSVTIEDQNSAPQIAKEGRKFCQTMRMVPLQNYLHEYKPSSYLSAAWNKLLSDPNYRVRGGLADAEPHYARVLGTTGLAAPMPIRGDYGRSNINDLMGFPPTPGAYDAITDTAERIFDPTHPFSPRWDFITNDRDEYSWMSLWYNPSGVYCAGGPNPPQQPPLSFINPTVKSNPGDGVIKTDLMLWRWGAFDFNIRWRDAFNQACMPFKECRKFFKCKGGRPCCAMNIDQRDSRVARWLRVCGPSGSIHNLCSHVNKELPPINPLKLRVVANESVPAPRNPTPLTAVAEPQQDHAGKAGGAYVIGTMDEYDASPTFLQRPALDPRDVPIGYSFREYFGDHRPYMRCWDTGIECGLASPLYPNKLKSTYGANVAVVGVGRVGDVYNNIPAQTCKLGGNHNSIDAGTGVGRKYELPNRDGTFIEYDVDPTMHWAELKLYQARAIREAGANCLLKHEKFFKMGVGEEKILTRAGAMYDRRVRDQAGNYSRTSAFPWAYTWRGYASDPVSDQRFPNFPSRSPAIEYGLSEAGPGDVIIFDQDVATNRLPYVAVVTEAGNNAAYNGSTPPGGEWVRAISYNHGKYPDVCGNTDSWNYGDQFTMYRDYNHMPPHLKEEWQELQSDTRVTEGATPTCDDPNLSTCVEQHWNNVKRMKLWQ